MKKYINSKVLYIKDWKKCELSAKNKMKSHVIREK